MTITQARAEHTTTAAKLEQLGLVAAEEQRPQLPPARFESAAMRRWPDYQICADGAPPNAAGTGPDLSRADFVWCMTAATWGFSVTDTAEMLLDVSEHARLPSNGEDYAERTAENAAGYVERRRRNRQGERRRP